MEKPVGRVYGSIPHLSSSENGGDKIITEGQERILTKSARDGNDQIIVSLKIDGSCCGVAKKDGKIFALTRSGYRAIESSFKQHEIFHRWVRNREQIFRDLLSDDQLIVGEWCIQAHGTKYKIEDDNDLFVPFDLFPRCPFMNLISLIEDYPLPILPFIHATSSISLKQAKSIMNSNFLRPDKHEGVVYRCERNGEFDFAAKWVRDKEDGKYLPGVSEREKPLWNYPPEKLLK